MHLKNILSIAIAFATRLPHARASELSVSSPQANGVVDATVFLRRAYHSSAVLDRRVYIDGGEFSFSKADGIAYESSNSLISIDLAQDWSNGSVTLHSNPKPPGVPNLRHGGIWVDRKEGILYTGFAGTTPVFGDTSPNPQGLWSFTPDGTGAGTWKNLNKTADASFTTKPRAFEGQVASGRGLGFFLGGFVESAAGTQQQQPIDSFITYDFSSGKAASSNVWEGSGLVHGWGHSGGINYVPYFGNRGVLINVGGHLDLREDNDGLVDFQTVQVYDIDNQRWFEQQTTGDIPQPRKEFCIAGALSSQHTYEILIYAGWDGHFGPAAKLYDSAFVLTLPGFYWVKVDYPPKHPRHGLTCNAVGGGQILVIGGLDSTQQQDGVDGSSTAGFNTQDPFTQGLAIFYLSGLTWSSTYSAKQSLQPPAAKIQHYYTIHGRQPLNGFSTPDLAALFSIDNTSDSDEGSSSSSSAASDHHATNTRAIVGGVLAGAAGVVAVTALTLFFRRRRHRRRAEANKEGVGGVGVPEEVRMPTLTTEITEAGVKDESQVSAVSYRGVEYGGGKGRVSSVSASVSEGVMTTTVPSPVEGTVEIDGQERVEMDVLERPGELSVSVSEDVTAVPSPMGRTVEIEGQERVEMDVLERPGELSASVSEDVTTVPSPVEGTVEIEGQERTGERSGEVAVVVVELPEDGTLLELPGNTGRAPVELS